MSAASKRINACALCARNEARPKCCANNLLESRGGECLAMRMSPFSGARLLEMLGLVERAACDGVGDERGEQ